MHSSSRNRKSDPFLMKKILFIFLTACFFFSCEKETIVIPQQHAGRTVLAFFWADRLTDGLSGVISAKALSGTAKVPASSIRLTNLVFFNIEYIFKRNNTYHENGLHLLSVFIRSCSLDFAYFYSVFLCFCNLVLSELMYL